MAVLQFSPQNEYGIEHHFEMHRFPLFTICDLSQQYLFLLIVPQTGEKWVA